MSDDRALAALRDHGRAALAALDAADDDDPKAAADRMAEAFRELVVLRDALIGCRRAGEDCAEYLSRTNALVSGAFGVERPINGFHRERIGRTRDALRAMVESLPR